MPTLTLKNARRSKRRRREDLGLLASRSLEAAPVLVNTRAPPCRFPETTLVEATQRRPCLAHPQARAPPAGSPGPPTSPWPTSRPALRARPRAPRRSTWVKDARALRAPTRVRARGARRSNFWSSRCSVSLRFSMRTWCVVPVFLRAERSAYPSYPTRLAQILPFSESFTVSSSKLC